MLVYIADGALQNISNGQAVHEGNPYCFTEIATVAICVVLPALYFHFGGRSRAKAVYKLEGKLAEFSDEQPETAEPIITHDDKICSSGFESTQMPQTFHKIVPPNRDLATPPVLRPQPSKAARNLARLNQAINTAAKAGEPDKAEKLLGELEQEGLQPDAISYNSVIHAWAKLGNIRRAEYWLKTMAEKGVEPNTISIIGFDTSVHENVEAD